MRSHAIIAELVPGRAVGGWARSGWPERQTPPTPWFASGGSGTRGLYEVWIYEDFDDQAETSEAIELGLDAALPAMFELTGTIGEFGRGERASASLTQQSLRFVMINRTPRESFPAAEAQRA